MDAYQIHKHVALGEYPDSFANLGTFLSQLPLNTRETQIEFDPPWIDMTLLCHLAITLRNVNRPQRDVTICFPNHKKLPFLWRCGFLQNAGIEHKHGCFRSFPDVWKHRPEDERERLNYSALLPEDLPPSEPFENGGYSPLAGDLCRRLLLQLESTAIWDAVFDSDLLASGEYLSIVLWELIQNSLDHASGNSIAVAGQVFSGNGLGANQAALTKQHFLEKRNCKLAQRRSWLSRNDHSQYLLIACVDDGVGIADGMRRDHGIDEARDATVLEMAFLREYSRRNTVHHRYDVHGLNLIGELISSYGGYLFLQSGNAQLEILDGHISSTELSSVLPLGGTCFQILLPLSAGERRSFGVPSVQTEESQKNRPPSNSIVVAHELRHISFRIPPPKTQWETAVKRIVELANRVDDVCFLDLSAMPRERHFLSLLLQCVRRRRFNHPTIIINSSRELFSAIRGLKLVDDGDESTALSRIDDDLSSVLTRGDNRLGLPLLLPITRLAPDSRSAAVKWIGLGGYSLEERERIIVLLDYLFYHSGEILEDELFRQAEKEGVNTDGATTLLRKLARVNPNLLRWNGATRSWRIVVSADDICHESDLSLRRQIEVAMAEVGLAKKDNPNTVYFLNWRADQDAYITNYYNVWNVVADPELAKVAASLLLRHANAVEGIGEKLAEADGVMSVTASAGLIARELARILRIPHWEAASVYDLKESEWVTDFEKGPVIIVDDLIDTGTASRRLISHAEALNATCIVILSLLASEEGRVSRESLDVPLVKILDVSLGRPKSDLVDRAKNDGVVCEVDPYTLEPFPERRLPTDWNKTLEDRKREVLELTTSGAIGAGHFVYSGHHYNVFFDIVRMLEQAAIASSTIDWFWTEVNRWYERTTKDAPHLSGKPISIVYPYFSPIAAFLHEIAPLSEDKCVADIQFHVAKPYRRSQDRRGYRLSQLAPGSARPVSELVVFVDDGVATGGTLSAIVDEVVEITSARTSGGGTHPEAALLALVVFDRIGMTPRKHLRNIEQYRSGLSFQYRPRYSFNLQSFFEQSCPVCQIRSALDRISKQHVGLSHLSEHFQTIRKLLSPTVITAISTLAPQRQAQLTSLLSASDIAAVIHARDLLFSDLPSAADIKSIISDDQQSAAARLEILLTVLKDSYLYRRVRDEDFILETVSRLVLHHNVTTTYRIWFILHLASISSDSSDDLARRILTEAIPSAIRKSPTVAVDDNRLQPVGMYFDENPECFSAIIGALWMLHERVPFIQNGTPNEAMETRWDFHWSRALSGTEYEYLFASTMSGSKEDVARKYADMLFCNFVTHFAMNHQESYRQRLIELHQCIRDNQRSAGKRNAAFPRHLMKYVVDSIRTVKQYYQLSDGLFPDAQLTALLDHHSEWTEGHSDGAALAELLNNTLVPIAEIDSDDTSIWKLLSELTPTARDVIDSAMVVLRRELRELRIKTTRGDGQLPFIEDDVDQLMTAIRLPDNDLDELYCFGTRDYLVRTVCHLLSNAIEHTPTENDSENLEHNVFVDVRTTSIPESESTGDRNIDLPRTNPRIVFSVSSKRTMSNAEISACFRRYGGLMIQKQIIETWGGRLDGRCIGGDRSEFFLETDLIEVGKLTV